MTTCGVCTKQPGKYKCPNCEIKYCSVACYKQHKPSHEKVKDPNLISTSTKGTETTIPASTGPPTGSNTISETAQSQLQSHAEQEPQFDLQSDHSEQTETKTQEDRHSQTTISEPQFDLQLDQSEQPETQTQMQQIQTSETKSSQQDTNEVLLHTPTNSHQQTLRSRDDVVSESMLAKIGQSPELVQLLQEKNLQKIILEIVQSNKSEELLRSHLETNKEFANFIDKMLLAIGYRDQT